MKYFSMFTGIGGFELGIKRAKPEWECVGYSEIDKFAVETFSNHFPELVNYGDATKIRPEQLPDFDLLVGGFPCQAFSVAGKRRGFDDTRGTLFFDIARILTDKRPRYLVLENVKGLLSHDKGKTFQRILEVLSNIGYGVQWQVLNSKDFGVPQNRERIFIIGHLRGEPRPKVFPIRETDSAVSEGSKQGNSQIQITQTIRSRYGNGSGSHILQINNPTHSNDRVYDPEGLSPTLNTMQGGNRQPFVALTERRTEEAKRIRKESQKQGRDYSPRRGKELVPRNDNKANTVTANHNKEHLLSNGIKIRRLTPLECERLQGFPDNWTIGSDTQRYKQCGNAVTVNVIETIFSKFNG